MFQPVPEPWPRREYFEHYMHTVRCTYSLTVHIDITHLRARLKQKGLRAYPAQIYMLATAVNRLPQFRMGLGSGGAPGYWAEVHPAYTVFNREAETFSSIWTPYDASFSRFYTACCTDIDQYSGAKSFAPKAGQPPNTFDISSLPWVDFTAFNLNVYGEGTHLAPIFTLGKYGEQTGTTTLPLAMQLHHAACDGYHVGQLVEALRTLAAECDGWLE